MDIPPTQLISPNILCIMSKVRVKTLIVMLHASQKHIYLPVWNCQLGPTRQNAGNSRRQFYIFLRRVRLYCSSILILKGTLDKLDRNTDEFKEFRQGLQSSILEHLSKKEYESRWSALIFCATICKISNEIFLEETIIVNRIDDLTREIYLPKNRKPFKKQIELAELLSHVTGTHFGKQFERKAQSRKYDDVHDLVNQENVSDVKRRDLTKYRFCLGWFFN